MLRDSRLDVHNLNVGFTTRTYSNSLVYVAFNDTCVVSCDRFHCFDCICPFVFGAFTHKVQQITPNVLLKHFAYVSAPPATRNSHNTQMTRNESRQ